MHTIQAVPRYPQKVSRYPKKVSRYPQTVSRDPPKVSRCTHTLAARSFSSQSPNE